MMHKRKFSKTLLFYLSLLVTVMTSPPHATAQLAQNVSPQQTSGLVTEVITTSGFTYVQVDTGKTKVWAAGVGSAQVKKGDRVGFSTEMPMQNYHSKKLNRDFSLIFFVRQFFSENPASANVVPNRQTEDPRTIQSATIKFLANTREVKVGESLREAMLDGLKGQQKKLSDFKGRPLIINVWASWCGPCRAEMDSLQGLANRYNGKQLNIIGISTDDFRNDALSLIKQTGISFENFLDNKLQMEKMLGANMIPLTVLVDEQGRILEKVQGARDWNSPDMVDAIGEVFQLKLRD
jgi:thiol-disulfide isomerase/thioredoxin